MSKRQWMVLLMLFLTYLLLGASIFYHIESRLEIEKVAKAREERIEINALLHEHYMPKEAEEQHEILERLTRYCGKSVYNYTENETDPLKWDFYNSFYFAYTVVSTIGYGNLAPTNMLSRILMIFYGVVGIPMNGILLSQLGEFFGLVFVRAHKKYKSYKHSQSEYSKKLTPLETRKAGLAAQIFMYLTPGFVMFIFFPAFLFSHYEGWAYDEAVYYAFVTLTTIGFGDYVAGQDNTKGSGVLFILYKTFLIAWISFGLGYIVMIMTFIARGMRSKKITRLEHKLAMNLKHTQSKIWNEFNKEVGYLRRVFNELQLSKVKRIYVDEYDYEAPPAKFQRSNSFPDLRDLVYGGLPNPLPPHPRRRANSEVVPMEPPVVRVVSETDLQRIDKNATFASHAMVQPAELLARLVNILGYIPPPPDDEQEEIPSVDAGRPGVQGFSDKEILSNERGWNNSTWKIGGGGYDKSEATAARKPRSRAASEIRLDPRFEPSVQQRNVEWTWSGPSASRKIQELIKARRNGAAASAAAGTTSKDAKCKFPNLALPKSVPKTLLPRWIKQFSNKREGAGSRARNSVSVGDLESREGENYLTQPSGGLRINGGRQPGLGLFSAGYEQADPSSRPYFTHTGAANLASSLEGSNLLEETSLADFLRALTALHTRVGAVPDEYVRTKPQRKMGTASLTPPKLPSLLTLFSPPPGTPASATQSHQNTVNASTAYNAAGRRFSLRTAENSGNSTPNYIRRNSLAHHQAAKPRRRFSLRPVVTPLGNSPQSGSPYLSGMPRPVKEQSVPPSPPYSSEGFVVECPKGSLVEKEGALGVSTPITASTGIRRFSLRPTPQSEISQAPPTAPSALTKGLPRWRAGMLQRQINQINLQRRVRAFSLSDVNTEGTKASERNATPALSPLVDGVRILGGPKDLAAKSSTQKTVTIVSPSAEELAALRTNDSRQSAAARIADSTRPQTDQQQQPAASAAQTPRPRVPYVRAISAMSNPFASIDDARPPISTNPFVPNAASGLPGQGDPFPTPNRDIISASKAFASKIEGPDIRSEAGTAPSVGESGKTDDSTGRTVYQALQSVKNIEAAPPVFSNDSVEKEANERKLAKVEVAAKPPERKITPVKTDPVKKTSVSSCSTMETDSKGASRKVSAVSIGHWTDSRKPGGSRKISTVSQQSSDSVASSSRKSSTNINPGEKPRVSIDSYKPLMEVKIEKPSENPFERYRATMRLSVSDGDSLTEVKVETPESNSSRNAETQERKFSTKLGRGPRESDS